MHCSAFDNSLTYSKHLAMGFCATFVYCIFPENHPVYNHHNGKFKTGKLIHPRKKTQKKNDFALNECICSKFEANYHDDAITILNKCDWTQIILPLQWEFFFYYKIQNMQKYFPHPKKRILIEPLTCCALVLGSDVGCLSSTGNKCISSYITIQVIFK